jgi:hypothetical protein
MVVENCGGRRAGCFDGDAGDTPVTTAQILN